MTRRYRNSSLDVTIDVTKAAENNIAKLPKKGFLADLSEFMSEVGSDYAYVGASGQQLRINLVWPPENRMERRRRA